ncbi:hypothetical protein SYNPS1DRAFT_31848 [Syncephalis pseudoplumigaleata]|uniref:tRNA-splicing endonuclease subunit Sen54 N-terminal domain-containing protein n=1 Tax=Syncephalis pseudoplumigaleata TaxID=1712513 RepID=A0A4V1J0S2_9FUNG|nr:hypothetical protein SYNPS1DRAFT_31848 [Syncephalis pseudoplumigaleata]|eukprot:RKP22549.1 hypothetical protein SYNPS1DRAFT_31848 [Syncephalis pseudoplumigaleata]
MDIANEQEDELLEVEQLARLSKSLLRHRQGGAIRKQAIHATPLTLPMLLSEERYASRLCASRHLSRVAWMPTIGRASVLMQRGNHLQRLGYRQLGVHYLYAEEVLFMLGRSVLCVSVQGVSVVALQEAYAHLLPHLSHTSLASYSSYAYLKRLGFTVVRPSSSPAAAATTTVAVQHSISMGARIIAWISRLLTSCGSLTHTPSSKAPITSSMVTFE